VDITKITGTGNEGRVTKADVETYLQKQETAQVTEKPALAERERQAPPQPPPGVTSSNRREERVRMSRRRRTIAQRLLEAKQTHADDIQRDRHERRNGYTQTYNEFQKRYRIKLGFIFLVKARSTP
jgi:2-oxoglutarate dehydrogenase E2 component (dihydrolipoamide succinyltransferase)